MTEGRGLDEEGAMAVTLIQYIELILVIHLLHFY